MCSPGCLPRPVRGEAALVVVVVVVRVPDADPVQLSGAAQVVSAAPAVVETGSKSRSHPTGDNLLTSGLEGW